MHPIIEAEQSYENGISCGFGFGQPRGVSLIIPKLLKGFPIGNQNSLKQNGCHVQRQFRPADNMYHPWRLRNHCWNRAYGYRIFPWYHNGSLRCGLRRMLNTR